jgi:hypothetical protein
MPRGEDDSSGEPLASCVIVGLRATMADNRLSHVVVGALTVVVGALTPLAVRQYREISTAAGWH